MHIFCTEVSKYDSFQNGWGYWEGDQGRSFPKEYAWTQCRLPNGSLMLSMADIPIAGVHFTGIIGNILWASSKAFYRFQQKGQTFFAFETEQASFEYEYPS